LSLDINPVGLADRVFCIFEQENAVFCRFVLAFQAKNEDFLPTETMGESMISLLLT